MTDDEIQGARADELEPLGRYRGGEGIDVTTRAIFDVLFEHDQPLDRDTLVRETFERVAPAVHYHARRVYVRKIQHDRARRGTPKPVETTVETAWRWYASKTLRRCVQRNILVLADGSYAPNPRHAPFVRRPDGSKVAYTRDEWQGLAPHDRAVGEIHVMQMELGRLLERMNKDDLAFALLLAIEHFQPRRAGPTGKRLVRARIKWLLDRPKTDEARAWLIHELARRAFEEGR